MSESQAAQAATSRARGEPRIRSGIGGWDFAPWRDTFYPADVPKRSQLDYASRALATIEVNSTFYRAQTSVTYEKWRSATPPGFVFALKAPRYLTHRRRLADAAAGIGDFVNPLAALGKRLGPINWQLAPTRAFDADDVAAFLALLPRRLGRHRLHHALEVRHPSFACAAFVDLARAAGVTIVCTDSPDHPNIADITGDIVYLRLMQAEATVATGYRKPDLRRWRRRAETWLRGGAPADLACAGSNAAAPRPRDVFVYFINGAKMRAPAAAIAFATMAP